MKLNKLHIEGIISYKKKGWSNYRIADLFEVDESTIRRALKKERVEEQKRKEFDSGATDYIALSTPITHVGPIIVTADWHFPLFDPVLGNKVFKTAEETGIDTLLIAGDVFHMDALSRFEPKQKDVELWEEIQVAQESMSVLLDHFKHIYVIKGNHDMRLVKALGFYIQFEQAMRMVFGSLGDDLLKRITFSNLDHMWVKPKKKSSSYESWYVCHPSSSYTQVPLSKGRVLSDKYNTNVIAAHSHHFAMGFARDGKRVVAEAGGLFDASKTEYLQETTSYPIWQQGYMWLDWTVKGLLGLDTLPEFWTPRG